MKIKLLAITLLLPLLFTGCSIDSKWVRDTEDGTRSTAVDHHLPPGAKAPKTSEPYKAPGAPDKLIVAEPVGLIETNKPKLNALKAQITELQKLSEAELTVYVKAKLGPVERDSVEGALAQVPLKDRPTLFLAWQQYAQFYSGKFGVGLAEMASRFVIIFQGALAKGTAFEGLWAIEEAYDFLLLPKTQGGLGGKAISEKEKDNFASIAVVQASPAVHFPEDWSYVHSLVVQIRELRKLDDKNFSENVKKYIEGKKEDRGLGLTGDSAKILMALVFAAPESNEAGIERSAFFAPRLMMVFLTTQYAMAPLKEFGLGMELEAAVSFVEKMVKQRPPEYEGLALELLILHRKAYKNELTKGTSPENAIGIADLAATVTYLVGLAGR